MSSGWGVGEYPKSMIQLTNNLEGLFRTLELDSVLPPEAWSSGIVEIRSDLRRLGLEAEAVVVQGLSFSAAALDFENFPLLARAHAAVDDILTLSLPPEIVRWVFRMVARAEEIEIHMDAMTEDLVHMAALPLDLSDPTPALAKFFLFEMVRLQLILLARRHPNEVFGRGLELDDLSPMAEKQVVTWLAECPPADVRSRLIMEAAACLELSAQITLLKTELLRVGADLAEGLAFRARMESELSQCESSDSLMIRNGLLAPVLGIQQVSLEELRSRHRLAMGDVNLEALYKRFQRMKKRKKLPKRKGIALLDVIKMILDGDDEEVLQ